MLVEEKALAKLKLVHQPSPRVLACRRNGRLGGLARAKKVTSEKMKEWSSRGGKATFDRYGSGLMSFITKKRKHVGRFRKPVAARRKVA